MSERPLRVAVFTPDFPPARGGIQHLVHRLTEHLVRFRRVVVTIDHPGAPEFDLSQPFAVDRARPARRRAIAIGLLNAQALRSAIRFRPDVVLSAHIVTSPAAAVLTRTLGVPFVQYLHAAEVGTRPRLARFAVHSAAMTIVVSRHTEQLGLAVGASAHRLRHIPPGVDLPRHRDDRRAARPTVVTVARLESRYKGLDVMCRALPLVRARVPDVEWVIVGDGPLRGEVERLAAAHGLDGAVRFVGEVTDDQRDRLLQRAHLFAMPSRLPARRLGGEGFGIVYLEAGANGLPVVAGNVGGALDAVIDQRTGLLVDPADHVAVADAIDELLRDPARAAALGRAGEERAREFSWPRIAERVEQVLVDVTESDS
jgi:phosphatidylinositol alpha-1,6-mannosyltransferase